MSTFKGKYVGQGTVGVTYRTGKRQCLKVYRPGVAQSIMKAELDFFRTLHGKVRVPEPGKIIQVELTPDLVAMIKEDPQFPLREEFSQDRSFFALEKQFIEGETLEGNVTAPVWNSYMDLNEEIFGRKYSAGDFRPSNYICRSDNMVYFIDADKSLKITPDQIKEQRDKMEELPREQIGKPFSLLTKRSPHPRT